jgi:tetratricopeptide (TPR) repeat protein
VTIVLASWSMLSVSSAATQDTLARAKDLYTSAAYDEALAVLDRVDDPSAGKTAEADEYRAYCLLALGRTDDAHQVIQQIVEANPSFQPSEAQVSPRLQEAFRDVRRRVLPSIVRRAYADGKAAFERKDFEAAGRQFTRVVALADDAAAGAPELADLRILSNGFLDLMKPPPALQPPTPSAEPPAPPARDVPVASSIYGPDDRDVTPPVAISQPVPSWHPATRQDKQAYDGRLILDIDERGDVTAVTLQGNLNPAYASQLRHAAAAWKYQPATRSGVPVKYRKPVGIRLNPVE